MIRGSREGMDRKGDEARRYNETIEITDSENMERRKHVRKGGGIYDEGGSPQIPWQ